MGGYCSNNSNMAWLVLLLGVLWLANTDFFTNFNDFYGVDQEYGTEMPSSIKSNYKTLKNTGRDKGVLKPKGPYLEEARLSSNVNGTEFAGFESNSRQGYDLNGYSLLNNNNKRVTNTNNIGGYNFFPLKEGFTTGRNSLTVDDIFKSADVEDFSGVNFSSKLLDDDTPNPNKVNGCKNCESGECPHCNNDHSECSNCEAGGCPHCNKRDVAKKEDVGEVYVKMIYTNWCGFSKKAIPDFEKLMNEMNGKVVNGNQIIVEMVDADTDEGKVQAKQYGVKGFPTHIIVKDGKHSKMKSRDYDGMKSEIENM